MLAIYKREFRSYFTSLTGCIIMAALFFMCGLLTSVLNFMYTYASFEYVLGNTWMQFALILAIPILCMGSIAEDRKNRTDQLLYSLPLKTSSVVLGKYFALVSIYAIICAVMGIVPLILSFYGTVGFASAYLSLLGFFLLGAAMIAICLFFSSLTESQLVAAVLGVFGLVAFMLMGSLSTFVPSTLMASVICFAVVAVVIVVILYITTKNYIVAGSALVVFALIITLVSLLLPDTMTGLFPKVLNYLALFDRFEKLTGGIFDLTAIIYYLSVSVFFVFVSVQKMEKRRWS